MAQQDSQSHNSFWKSTSGIVFLCFLSVIVFLLAFEHRAHIFTGNTFLFVLLGLCIGVHIFMHGSHGGHSGRREKEADPTSQKTNYIISKARESGTTDGERK